jgi:hypothetical protein
MFMSQSRFLQQRALSLVVLCGFNHPSPKLSKHLPFLSLSLYFLVYRGTVQTQ